MSVTFRIKRRASGGQSGAPSSLKTSELAYSEVDDILYVGFGDDGGGNATSIKVLAGFGAFMRLISDQTIAGIKTFTSSPVGPTPASNDNSTKLATTEFVKTALQGVTGNVAWGAITGTITNQTDFITYIASQISALVNSAPGTLDTLNELAAALGNDPNFATTITSSIATKLSKSSNLSDLVDIPTARSNLGLGTMAIQNANNVTITGGSINGVILDGGTY